MPSGLGIASAGKFSQRVSIARLPRHELFPFEAGRNRVEKFDQPRPASSSAFAAAPAQAEIAATGTADIS
ncbi:MAG: hypothetical protein R3C40_07285 [Parvularculaceae bacterium]